MESNVGQFGNFYDSDGSSDITLKFSGREIKAHKTVLCSHSSWFTSAIGPNSQFSEAHSDTLELHDDDPDALEWMFRWMYHGDEGVFKSEENDDASEEMADAAEDDDDDADEGNDDSYVEYDGTSSWEFYLKLSVVADKYGCSMQLAETAFEKFLDHVGMKPLYKEHIRALILLSKQAPQARIKTYLAQYDWIAIHFISETPRVRRAMMDDPELALLMIDAMFEAGEKKIWGPEWE